jgi:hypothetical protein
MSKAKTNALDTLRALIAERQQYEQWISTLEAKREGTPEHVFERVQGDYRSRLDRVVGEIKGHAEELQLSISTLSSRLVEVAREEDTRREGLQEAELRAAVGEYEPSQWESIKSEAESALEKIAADRVSLDSQLSELRAIQKLSEMTPQIPGGEHIQVAAPTSVAVEPEVLAVRETPLAETPAPAQASAPASSQQAQAGHRAGTAAAERESAPPAAPTAPAVSSTQGAPPQAAPQQAQPATASPAAPATPPGERLPLEPVAAAASAAASAAAKPRVRTPPGGVSAARSRSEAAKPDSAKTLKCPECGTANYPTEWYCERCGGELATM